MTVSWNAQRPLRTYDDAMVLIHDTIRAAGAVCLSLDCITVLRMESVSVLWSATAEFQDSNRDRSAKASRAVVTDHYAAIIDASCALLRTLGYSTVAGRIESATLQSMRGGRTG